MRGISDLIKHLVIINVIFFFSTFIFGNIVYDLFALHYFENEKFEYWQLLSHMFMHGNINHIFFNMFGLWMFGTPLEQIWGKNKFIFFYLSTGIGAAFLQMLLYNFQINNLNEILYSFGLNNDQLDTFYQTRYLPNSIIEIVNSRDLTSTFSSALTSFNSVMVGASGALYGVLVAFAILFPNAQLMLLKNKTQHIVLTYIKKNY